MTKVNLTVLVCTVMCASLVATAQTATVKPPSSAEREVRQFYESYAEDLRRHRREAIADRYDRRGVYLMGNGQKKLVAFEAVKDRYLTRWKGPKSFAWHDLSFEILTRDIAVVLGRFEWQSEDEKTLNFSYTGVLVKRNGKWRIRVEDESRGL